jgi:hypothetical protein
MTQKRTSNQVRFVGEEAKRFNRLAESPDASVCGRRDAYYRYVTDTTAVHHKDGKVIVTFNADKKFDK